MNKIRFTFAIFLLYHFKKKLQRNMKSANLQFKNLEGKKFLNFDVSV